MLLSNYFKGDVPIRLSDRIDLVEFYVNSGIDKLVNGVSDSYDIQSKLFDYINQCYVRNWFDFDILTYFMNKIILKEKCCYSKDGDVPIRLSKTIWEDK